MNKLITYLLLAASVSMLFVGCSNKSSSEACRHEVTMNLDKGNYDAVLLSSCASPMQKGAAYFGKAGFDVKDVINNFSETGIISGSTNTQSDLSVYMTALVSKATGTTLADMDAAVTEYNQISATSENYKDAQFYISLVDAAKSLSLIKLVLPDSFSIVNGTLQMDTSCDYNNNGVPDDADATACALLTSASQPCTAGVTTVGDFSPITILNSGGTYSYSGTYRGLIIAVSGTGPHATCDTPNQFNKLLFQPKGTGIWVTATTTADICHDSLDPTRSWPCPLESATGAPVDLVQTIDATITGAMTSLSTSLTGTQASDVQTAIQDIKNQACCGCSTTQTTQYQACSQACATPCDSQAIANYIQTNLK